MRAVGIGDKPQLVYSRDEGAEEEQVHEGDEAGRAFGGGVTDQRVEAPEYGDGADDEQDQDVDGGDDIGFEVSIDEISLLEGG